VRGARGRKLPRVPLLATLAVVLTLAGSPQAPPSAEEQRLFADGLKAFDGGDARAAERAWKAGYAVAHDPAFLVRIGEAQEKAGAGAEAAESYRRYLREAPDASDRPDIEQRLARLLPARPAGAPAPSRDAADATQEFGSGATPALPTAPAAPRAAVPAVDAGAGPAANDEEESGWNRYNVTAWSATAATALLLGTAAFFGAQASSKAGDVSRLLDFRDEKGAPLAYTPDVARKYEGALADGRRYDRDAKLALLGAAGTAVVAAVFFVLDAALPQKSSVAFAPAADGPGVLAAWGRRF
jgi:hypothetical protein